MRISILSVALSALAFIPTTLAAPTAELNPSTGFPVLDQHFKEKRGHGWRPACNNQTMRVRKDFDTMPPHERKAYTSAINCLRKQPSKLDQKLYPAATDRFMDYAVVHVNRTKLVHLDGYFLTWHRYFLQLYEDDLRQICGYTGSFPYWNFPATADNLRGSNIFNGDQYSMSGDGLYTGDSPVVLAPTFSLPHGTGGGCVTSGPFANWTVPMQDIPITVILAGLPLPPTAFNLNSSCLTRDLNSFVAKTWCNYTDVEIAVNSPSIADFSTGINGVLGGTELGLHSGAHFTMGAPASSLFVSPQDPIWYPLHTMLDRVYVSWQQRHPELAMDLFGTETAANVPPSANVTLDSVHPDWGYFSTTPYTIRELISTTAGPFCYTYDTQA